MKRRTIVFDLDGTVANINHRLPLIQRKKPDWDAFYEACDKDTVNEWCKEIIWNSLKAGTDVCIVSARDRRVLAKTEYWMYENVLNFLTPGQLDNYPGYGRFEMFLLRDGDSTPDVELKRQWLLKHGKENIVFVVDDRQRVVDFWRSEGLVCLQCYAWTEWKNLPIRDKLVKLGEDPKKWENKDGQRNIDLITGKRICPEE